MSNYILKEDLNSFLWIDIDSVQAQLIVDTAETIFNQLIGSDWLVQSQKTEYFYDWDFGLGKIGRVFFLKTYNPTVITTINGTSPGTINVNYTLIGRRLELEYAKEFPTTFPRRHTVVYTSGLATIPSEIKTACLYISKGLYEQKKNMNVASFKQDLLSVNYNGKDFLTLLSDPSEITFINLIISKYLIPIYYVV